MNFKVGDIVCLKSGGPNMTIQSIQEKPYSVLSVGDLHCIWFENGALKNNSFKPATVTQVPNHTGPLEMRSV